MSIDLTDDMHLYLAKHYFKSKDCLSLALSGVSDRFTFLYGNNRRVLDISRCTFLAPQTWMAFFREHIQPSAVSIRVFDANHIYWLSSEILCGCIVQIKNLEELRIYDTKISLLDLPNIFRSCPKLTKLSFSLAERNMDRYQEGVMEKSSLDLLTAGFARLADLKMFVMLTGTYDEPDDLLFSIGDIWLVTLGVVSGLHQSAYRTELTHDMPSPRPIRPTPDNQSGESALSSSMDFDDDYDVEEKLLGHVDHMKEFFPHLEWMRSLKSLVIIKRSEEFFRYVDPLGNELISWIFCKNEYANNLRLPTSLERIWLDGLSHLWLSEDDFTCPTVKSILISGNDSSEGFKLDHERFRQLEQLGGIYFHNGFSHLPNLRFVHGETSYKNKSCKEFFETHPLLEQLYLNHAFYKEVAIAGNWRLLRLKVLNYHCFRLKTHNIDRLVDACPNIEELHVSFGNFCSNETEMAETRDFFNTIRFEKLKWLTVNRLCLRDGSRFPLIAEQCPKIERLHLDGCFLPDTLFSRLNNQFLVAENLRDLRLCWSIHHHSREIRHRYSDMSARVIVLLKDLKKSCPKLERIALIQVRGICPLSQELEDYLLTFTSEMEHLAFIYLTGFNIDPARAETIKEKLIETALPLRPSFWCHIGLESVEGNDPSVPRMHYQEMIFPFDFSLSPNF